MSASNGSRTLPGPYCEQVVIGAGQPNLPSRTPLEELFASHAEEVVQPLQPQAVPQPRPEPDALSRPQPEPAAVTTPESATDLTAQYKWLREERKRLEVYTMNQFAILTQQRDELTARRADAESKFILREQELNRQLKLVAERTAAVELREQQAARAEASWAQKSDEAAAAEKRVLALEQTSARLQRGIEQQRMTLEHLRLQSTQFQESARAAEVELLAFEKYLQTRTNEWNEAKVRFETQREQLEKRAVRMEQTEESLRRREGELEELEAQLRCEIEQRQQQLACEFEEVENIRRTLRAKSLTGTNVIANGSGRS
jgi:hypothetical protein